MKFSIQHQRSLVGNDILVGIEAEGKELISGVKTILDGFEIADDDLNQPCVSYERQFLQAGSAGPHQQHQLSVIVTDPDGNLKAADRRWKDVT